MVDAEFRIFIDTMDDKYIYCHQLTYGVHEVNIMVDHIFRLETNSWIRYYEGPCGTLWILAAKSHQ